ncbi:MAG TPA: 2,3-bisphosphoglycerate-independent phosphoglycerate mutase [Solirubrobacteraceae bacterium]
MTKGPQKLPVERAALIVLDGWGLADPGPGNAIELAETPVFDELWARFPTTTLTASGRAVGLPDGQMGNSEVGHLNLGAGSVVMQDLTRIDAAAEGGELAANQALRDAFKAAERVHIIGLVSAGGVHSSMDHLKALIELAASLDVPDLVVHAFTDGRDTTPKSGAGYLETVTAWMSESGCGRFGSVVGRYYAMDRDKRWDRVKLAYGMLVHGRAEHHVDTAVGAARAAYARDETDEFITPSLVGEEACIRPDDSVLGLNFRPDRMREITRALAEPGFDEFDREGPEPVKHYTMMTEYEEGWPYPIAFPPQRPETTISAVIAARGERQLHVAETEKYPHVTYFFNGGEETPYDGEERELVPSPRDVPTYDHKPQMSAPEAAEAFVTAWGQAPPRFGIINFANADMVGHTGVIEAAVTAVETVDRCLGDVVQAVLETGGACLITADHGNADNMLEPDGSPNTAHSLNPVPVIVTVPDLALRSGGVLADVAPTLLQMMGIEQPPEMSGASLIDED